ncbi:MAG: S41 family peptidase [Bacteroidales bacterium]|jgi:carboxyl-terminal processing protease
MIREKKTLFSILIIYALSINFIFSQQKNYQQGQLQKFSKVYQLINGIYVDSVDNHKLIEVALESMLKELDPHSGYMTAEETKAANELLQGNFEGIGIQYQLVEDTITVISPITGGPSEKVGIMAGDKIIEIDGKPATGKKITTTWVQKQLKGPKDTEVKVKIFRLAEKEFLDFTIVRDVIPMHSIDVWYMVDSEIGYLKLNRFARTSAAEFEEAVADLKEKGMKKLILDLRNNPGGFLDVAIKLCDEFLPKDKLIVYTEGRVYPRKDALATEEGIWEKGDVAVLINEGSASASEILSGAIQDWDRGAVIGRRSFGKGLVQSQYSLQDSSQVRITVARYYTPSGRCIQKPYDKGSDDYFKDLEKRLQHGELMNKDSIQFPDSLIYKTESGRIVYGGGGIMPDIFVPIDTTLYSEFYKKIITKGIANSFSYRYVEKNRKKLNKKYPTEEKFINNFYLSDLEIDEVTELCRASGIEIDNFNLDKSSILVETQLKALIGRSLFNIGTYYKVINAIEPEFNKAIEYFTN